MSRCLENDSIYSLVNILPSINVLVYYRLIDQACLQLENAEVSNATDEHFVKTCFLWGFHKLKEGVF